MGYAEIARILKVSYRHALSLIRCKARSVTSLDYLGETVVEVQKPADGPRPGRPSKLTDPV